MTTLVIVESPSKAKTINKYLGSGYQVLASFGHIRDLPPKNGSVVPEENFHMLWELSGRSSKPVTDILSAAKKSDTIILATDPDREGEAISWHVQEVLKEKKLLNKVKLQRVTFNEITKKAVQKAFESPRDVDIDLVEAYLARRALDYLVGFTLSPVLWRKLPGSKSAGRVQSVALRLICDRESEIEKFLSEEFWTIEGEFQSSSNNAAKFAARLTHLNGEKLEKFTLNTKTAADAALAALQGKNWTVDSLEEKVVRQNPAPPFITSTLQQEASRKLGYGASRTMRIAQRLYEGIEIGGETVGLITYMRTDGVQLSADAIDACRDYASKAFGSQYLPPAHRVYQSRQKNAQEAHEAIRPTAMTRTPDDMRRVLPEEEWKLYDLIWKRTLACQMESASFNRLTVDITDTPKTAKSHTFRAVGSALIFDGFLKVYREDRDEAEENGNGNGTDEYDRRLPPLKTSESLGLRDSSNEQHFTQPPPRYTEASLVKKLEELSIGRPSTYASIIQVLQDRNYVIIDKKRFVPENRGRVVTSFLKHFFARYVAYDFTADMEKQLDEISAGQLPWKKVLSDFWTAFSGAIGDTKDLTITAVLDALDADLSDHFFPPKVDSETGKPLPVQNPRECPSCQTGRLGLKLGKTGGFIGCSNYPDCRYTRPLSLEVEEDNAGDSAGGFAERDLGIDPVTGLTIFLKKGPYGAYVQLGDGSVTAVTEVETPPAAEEKPAKSAKATKAKPAKTKKAAAAPKPKRASLPRGLSAADVTLDQALQLLALPRDIGHHPETGEMIQAGLGRFGPYLKHAGKFKSLPKEDDLFSIGLNRAVVVLAMESPKREGAAGKTASRGRFAAKKSTTASAKPKTAAKATTQKTAKGKTGSTS